MKKTTMRLITVLTAFVLLATYVLPGAVLADESVYGNEALVQGTISEHEATSDNLENTDNKCAEETAAGEDVTDSEAVSDEEEETTEPAEAAEAESNPAEPSETASIEAGTDETGADETGSDESATTEETAAEEATSTEETATEETASTENTADSEETNTEEAAGTEDTEDSEDAAETKDEANADTEAEDDAEANTLDEETGDEELDDGDDTIIIGENETIAAPVITGIDVAASGVAISWGAVEGAEGYVVYRRTASDTEWKRLKKVTGTQYTDTTAETGNNYYYTVRAYNTVNGSENRSGYYYPGTYYIYLATPKITSAYNVANAIRISWDAVSGAGQYFIYRKAGRTGSYQKIAETADTLYDDSSVISGTVYYYVVRAAASAAGNTYRSFYNTGTGIVCLGTPLMTGISELTGGYKLSWNKVEASDYYLVYRKTAGEKWQRIATVTDLSYTDTVQTSGTKYLYTVRAVRRNGTNNIYSGYNDKGSGYIHLATPKVESVVNNTQGIRVSWGAVKGAQVYRVYRKTGYEGSYTFIGNSSRTYYIDKTAASGKTYYYTVRAMTSDEDGTYRSHYQNSYKYTYFLGIPQLTSVSANSKGYALNWEAVKGAEGYVVYRKTEGGKWARISVVSTNTFTDSTGKEGTKYYYTVKAYKKVGSHTFYGTYNTNGLGYRYLTTPKMNATSNAAAGIKVTWAESKGADSYRVYRKEGASGSYVLLGTVTDTRFVDKTIVSGREYYYTVRACATDADSKTYSSYERPGAGGVSLAAPQLVSAKETYLTGTTISWEKVTGADKYKIYRKTKNGSWGVLGYTTTTSYTDYSGVVGTEYYYTVRAMKTSGTNNYSGGYDAAGLSCVYMKSLSDMLKSEGSLSGFQKSMINTAYATPATGAGLCAAWVLNVLAQLGITYDYLLSFRSSAYSYAATSGLADAEYAYDTGFNANDFWAYICYSDDLSDLKPGMIVATRSSYTNLGSQFGHIGIYLGDNTILSSIGYLEYMTVSGFYQKYNNTPYGSTMRWGFAP